MRYKKVKNFILVDELNKKELTKKTSGNSKTFQACIDGKSMKGFPAFYEVMRQAFNFPDYSSQNFNSLNECINDLSWIDADYYRVIIFNYFDCLSEEYEEDLVIFTRILSDAVIEWKSGIFLGEPWDRPSIEFDIYIICNGLEEVKRFERLAEKF